LGHPIAAAGDELLGKKKFEERLAISWQTSVRTE
jgi:hypothetical protein